MKYTSPLACLFPVAYVQAVHACMASLLFRIATIINPIYTGSTRFSNKLSIVFSRRPRQSVFFLLGGISECVEHWVLCRLVSQNACVETDFGSPSLLQRPQCCTGRVGFILPCSLREWGGDLHSLSDTSRALCVDPCLSFTPCVRGEPSPRRPVN